MIQYGTSFLGDDYTCFYTGLGIVFGPPETTAGDILE